MDGRQQLIESRCHSKIVCNTFYDTPVFKERYLFSWFNGEFVLHVIIGYVKET